MERISSPEIACLIAATAGLKRSTWPTISVTPARRAAVDDVAPLLDRGGDRLLDQDVDLARDAGERDLVMKMGRRRDGHGIDALGEQCSRRFERAAADELGGARPMFRQRIDDTDQRDVRQARQHAGMVAAHDAGADHANAQFALPQPVFASDPDPLELILSTPTDFSAHKMSHPGGSLARRHKCGECDHSCPDTF